MARTWKKCGREHMTWLSVSPYVFSAPSQFLSALQQNRAQSRLLYLFYDKESVKFPTCYFLISKTNFIFKAIKNAISMFYTLWTNQSTATSELYCKSPYKDHYKLEVIKSKYYAESSHRWDMGPEIKPQMCSDQLLDSPSNFLAYTYIH